MRDEATALNQQLNTIRPQFQQASHEDGRLAGAVRATGQSADRDSRNPQEPGKHRVWGGQGGAAEPFGQLDEPAGPVGHRVSALTAAKPEAKKVLLDREKVLGQLAGNREKQDPFDTVIKARGNTLQFYQEMGGLAGRIALALLIAASLPRRMLLRLFQAPGLLVIPVTYLFLFRHEPELFKWGIAAAGFLTVAQFSYFGEYLPKVFPVHLRATGGAFATNVGGRMIGTSAAFVTANLVAPLFPRANTFEQVAVAAALVGTSVFVVGLVLSFFLPEPKDAIDDPQTNVSEA